MTGRPIGARGLDELDTPSLTVDLGIFEDNVRLCMESLTGVRVRPHLKTAKSPEVARLLVNAGAAGVCVAKLSEAEVMLRAGIDDVLITTELADPRRAGDLFLAQIVWADETKVHERRAARSKRLERVNPRR